jgi:hypothetical protein
MEGKIEGTGRQEDRKARTMDNHKGTRRYCNLRQEALDLSLWRTRFGKGYRLEVRHTT